MDQTVIQYLQQAEAHKDAGRMNQAIEQYRQACQYLEEQTDLDLDARTQLAGMQNNLGNMLVQIGQYKAARKYLKGSVKIYEQLAATDRSHFAPYLALTYYNLAQASAKNEDTYGWRKNLRPAIELYKEAVADHPGLRPYLANALASLADSYTHDEPLMAEVHWKQCIAEYEKMLDQDPTVGPFLAAAWNNLAYNQKQEQANSKAVLSYTQALDIYQALSQEQPNEFDAFLANTYNNLGILFTEMQVPEEATPNFERALKIYEKMDQGMPGPHLPYRATIEHNLGIIYDDQQAFDTALEHYQTALAMRRKLADENPDSFLPDVCATSLNIATLYQAMLEESADMTYRARALELLAKTENDLKQIKQEGPVITSMNSDFNYFQTYFREITDADVQATRLLRRIEHWNDETFSTLDIHEKKAFQQKVRHAIDDHLTHHPGQPLIEEQRVIAYGHLTWIYLLEQDFPAALEASEEIDLLATGHLMPKINRAHALLFNEQFEEAMALYQRIKDDITVDKKRGKEVVKQDFQALALREVTHPYTEQVLQHLNK